MSYDAYEADVNPRREHESPLETAYLILSLVEFADGSTCLVFLQTA